MAFIAMGATTLKAQSLMNINFNDGTTQNIDVSTIKDITWTEIEGNMINGHEYVDLGVKNAQGQTIYWAKCNVGATKPYEYGDYYAWGETETKTVYSWETYKYAELIPGTPAEYDADGFLIKPATDDHYEGQNIGEDISGTQYDAARQNWGGSWRMPTNDEFSRLKTQCDWTWTEMKSSDGNPIKGYKVSNKSDNSKYIFLPAAGCRYDSGLGSAGSRGYYWSSSPYASGSSSAYCLYFPSSYQGGTNFDGRYYGQSVRAVCVSIE